jgi:hydrogenase nickel incorporation protein HypB
MCATCGCDDEASVRVIGPDGLQHPDHQPAHEHEHPHEHEHSHQDHQDHEPARTVVLQQKVLAKNDGLAAANRAWLAGQGILAINLMSSPGAGKTTLLERTAREAGPELGLSVIEGDQETTLDAARIEAAGCPVAQINTGAGCHLDASMVARGLRALGPRPGSLLVIENVGNLVCPALFDLGEAARVVISSVTEGADKPAKYPKMFRGADLVLLSKMDLLPYLDFDTARHAADLARISPQTRILPVSARTGEGLPAWYEWLRQHPRQQLGQQPGQRPEKRR